MATIAKGTWYNNPNKLFHVNFNTMELHAHHRQKFRVIMAYSVLSYGFTRLLKNCFRHTQKKNAFCGIIELNCSLWEAKIDVWSFSKSVYTLRAIELLERIVTQHISLFLAGNTVNAPRSARLVHIASLSFDELIKIKTLLISITEDELRSSAKEKRAKQKKSMVNELLPHNGGF